jgi:branched-chain amino acid transport system permease protein
MSVEAFVQTLLLGISQGALYALIALGYTLVYGIIELINFAHGDLFMLGSFASLTSLEFLSVNKGAPLPLWLGIILSLIIAMVFCALFNVLIERVAYRRLRNAPRLAPLIAAIGVSFILQNIGLWWRGASPLSFHTVLGQHNMFADMFGSQASISFNYEQLVVLVVTIPLLVLLNYVVYRTRLGKAMRATAQDREAAALMGINVNNTIAFAFLLAGALAGAAGLIFGIYTDSTVWNLGFDAGLKAFTAAVLGGIGNLVGATVGGFMIGIIAAYSSRLFGDAWTIVVVFSILILVLVFRPSGIMGEQTPDKV